jgi:hypothetical protein
VLFGEKRRGIIALWILKGGGGVLKEVPNLEENIKFAFNCTPNPLKGRAKSKSINMRYNIQLSKHSL